MAFYRVQLSFPADSALPRDVMTINPHFSGVDPQALVNALSGNVKAFALSAGRPFTIKAYDAQKNPPSYPLASHTEPGTAPASNYPREVSLCCSYYTTYNRPRFRGRLYMPQFVLTGQLGVRPSALQQQEVLDAAKAWFSPNMPESTGWVVYSHVERTGKGGVTNLWCDDEWDTVRRRGLKPTSRVTATFP